MSRISLYQNMDGKWVVYYNNASTQRVVVAVFNRDEMHIAKERVDNENRRLGFSV